MSARRIVVAALVASSVACGGPSEPKTSSVREAAHLRDGVLGRDVRALAPQVVAQADKDLDEARRAEAADDIVGAELLGSRATAGYSRAVVLARRARAEADLRDAEAEATRRGAEAEAHRRARLEQEDRGAQLERQRVVLAAGLTPTPTSKAADPERDKARLRAAAAYVVEARLLCGAARLVAPGAKLDAALAQVDAAETKVGAFGPGASAAAIDVSSRAREACLGALSSARAQAPATAARTKGDDLLAEVSSALHGEGAAPTRDERGVVVGLRDPFRGRALTPTALSRVEELARVARAKPDLRLQLVVPATANAADEGARVAAVKAAVERAGVPAERFAIERPNAGLAARVTGAPRLDVVLVVPAGS